MSIDRECPTCGAEYDTRRGSCPQCAAEEVRQSGITHFADDATLARIAELERENAELWEDAERLNWMEDKCRCYWVKIYAQPDAAMIFNHQGTGVRTAIDAAIQKEKENG